MQSDREKAREREKELAENEKANEDKESMNDEEQATLDGQFHEFSKLLDTKGPGIYMTLYKSDYWMRQAKVLDDRKVTMTDTGRHWWKWDKTDLNWDEWYEYLTDLCLYKNLNQEDVEASLTNCGLPGTMPVDVPQYKSYFDTYKPKEKGVF